MKILVTGSSGLVGAALIPELLNRGHFVIRLIRHNAAAQGPQLRWDPLAESMDSKDQLEGLDAVIHLAGESLAGGAWTPERKARIRDSRVQGTGFLCRTLAGLQRKPRVLLSASAVGYYGHRGDEVLTEAGARGDGFLASVCADWESATNPAIGAGIRVVCMRFGVVLSRNGGALPRMLPLFRMGLAGRLGDGRAFMSWIALDDLVRAVLFLLDHEAIAGPVNLVSPDPIRNGEFTRILGRVLHRPTLLPVPAWILKLVLGEMAEETLLSSSRVMPARLSSAGFVFRYPGLEQALLRVLQ